MTLTEEQKKEVKHLCRVLGIGKLEAIARVLAKEVKQPEQSEQSEQPPTLDE